jgi:predicted nucleic acid-binding protein
VDLRSGPFGGRLPVAVGSRRPDPILRLIERDVIRLDFVLDEHRPNVSRLLREYRDRPMSLADACLVRMAELADASHVFTPDRDSLGYRRKGRHVIPLLSPFG